jgi:hypothetical protein
MGQLNRQPAGILGFLGIKNFGRSPDELATILAGTWDLSAWYVANAAQYLLGSGTITATGGIAVHTVPPGKVWTVIGFDCQIITGAGDTVQYGFCQIAPGGTVPRVVYGTQENVAASQNTRRGLELYTAPLIVMPGEALGLSISNFTGAAVFNSVIRFVSMDF